MANFYLPNIIRRIHCGAVAAITAAAFCSTSSASAKPATPHPISYTQPDGTEILFYRSGDENSNSIISEDGRQLEFDADGFLREITPESAASRPALNAENQKKYLVKGTPFPSEGEPHALVILVDFPDKKFSMENPLTYYNDFLNKEGFDEYQATGSCRDFFINNSNGKFQPVFDVYGPVTMKREYSYYGQNDFYGNDLHPDELVIDACIALNDEVDFSNYDYNWDGDIDNIYIFHAGYGEADSPYATTIWPHSANVKDFRPSETHLVDGVAINRYGISNELDYRYKRPDGIGTFVHEFTHVLGFPDLYPTNYSGAFTPGNYSTMDYGSYNNQGRTPPHFTAFERMSFGWLTPEQFSQTGLHTLEPIHQSNKAYILPTEREDEFYLFENRQLESYDAYIPGHGMLVWHIDFKQDVWDNNCVNNNSRHQYVDLIEADNLKNKGTTSGDPFPGVYNVTDLSFSTSPSLFSWAGKSLAYKLSKISESQSGIISFLIEDETAAIDEITSDFDNAQTLPISIENGIITNRSEKIIAITDIAGRTIEHLNPGASGSSSLPAGIYIISIPGQLARKIRI